MKRRVIVTRIATTVETYEVDAVDERDARNVVQSIRREAHYIADPAEHAAWVASVQHSYTRRVLEPVLTAAQLGVVSRASLIGPMCFRCQGAKHRWMPVLLDEHGYCPDCVRAMGGGE